MAKPKSEEIAPVSKHGPSMTLRLRTKDQIKAIKKAAAKAGLSVNTWCCEVLARASEAQ